MDEKAQSAPNRVYEDFEPFFQWSSDEGSAMLMVMLPGFKRDELRVQVTSTPVLRINGERQISENTWRRFGKEFQIPSNCDTNEISAKFENGLLTVKFPKLITFTTSPQEEEGEEEAPIIMPSQQQQQQPRAEGEEPPQQKEGIKEQQPISDELKDKTKTQVEAATSRDRGKQGDKMVQRLKTRVLDLTLSLKSSKDQGRVKQLGLGAGGLITGLTKRPNILINIVVAILLVLMLAMYLKNALFRSSSSHHGESKFQEF